MHCNKRNEKFNICLQQWKKYSFHQSMLRYISVTPYQQPSGQLTPKGLPPSYFLLSLVADSRSGQYSILAKNWKELWLDEPLTKKQKSYRWIHICSDTLPESHSDLSSLVPTESSYCLMSVQVPIIHHHLEMGSFLLYPNS